MDLRHLRYFVAVADCGSVTQAAIRLRTAQPSLSRQLRDLERHVGVPLMTRNVHGIDLTAAGRAFLDHARLALSQAEAAVEAARRTAHPAKATFGMGFLTGYEVEWLSETLQLLRDDLPNIDVVVSSQPSPDLAQALRLGKLDVAFMRPERNSPDLEFQHLVSDPLVIVLPSDHRLARLKRIGPEDMAGESFISVSDNAPILKAMVDDYIRRHGIKLRGRFAADNFGIALSLISSTRALGMLPAYVRNFLPWSIVSRPLAGEQMSIDLALGYLRDNTAPPLRRFLARREELVRRVSRRAPRRPERASVPGPD